MVGREKKLVRHLSEANNETIWVQGSKTGEWEASIDSLGEDWIQLPVSTEQGDSGGPYFEKHGSDEYYLAGIHAWGMDTDNDGYYDDACRGNIAANIEKWLDISF